MTKYINDKIYWRQTWLSYRWTQPQKVSLEFPPNPHRAKPTLDAFIGADWNGLSTSPPRFGMRHVRFSGSDCAGSSIGPEIVIHFSGHVPIEIQFSLNSKSCVRSLESISIRPDSCLNHACPCHKLTDWQCLQNDNLMKNLHFKLEFALFSMGTIVHCRSKILYHRHRTIDLLDRWCCWKVDLLDKSCWAKVDLLDKLSNLDFSTPPTARLNWSCSIFLSFLVRQSSCGFWADLLVQFNWVSLTVTILLFDTSKWFGLLLLSST